MDRINHQNEVATPASAINSHEYYIL